MKILAFTWLLIAALCLSGPAVGQDDAAGKDTKPDGQSGGETGGEATAADSDRPARRGLREKPLWEIGVVGGGGWLPDYPAADENHVNGIALPYAVYRGDFFRIGDGAGPRGLFVDIPWLELNVGIDAAFPVDSDDNDARQGMDDLDYLLEAGPKLIVKLLHDDLVNELDLSLATRVVLSTDFANVRYEGITVNPALTYRRNDLFEIDLRAIASLGAIFGFDGFNDYFYEVQRDDVRPGRPRYRADPGYVGSEITLGLSWGLGARLRLFAGTQIGIWTGSANDNSPLFRDEVTYAVGGGLRWSFLASDRKVWR
jgi:outer membrane scaffolding protein for murein synthesis (MipA/OmpV family)